MRGIVVSPQPRAAEVGARVLEQGGNAFDAAIATAFCQMVVDPFMCGLGGMGACQFFSPTRKEHGMLEFYNRAGSKVVPGMWEQDVSGYTRISGYSLFEDYRSEVGYRSIMTPGTVAGFAALHQRFATWDWADLLSPAMEILKGGFPLPSYVSLFFDRETQPGLPPASVRLSATEETRRLWLKPDGSFYKPGDVVRNDDMLRTLQRLADNGPDDFYRGKIAQEIIDDLEKNGAYVTADDLRDYKVRWRKPLHTDYRGYDVYSSPPPGGGLTVLETLNFLEGYEFDPGLHGEGDHLHILASAMAWSHTDRKRFLADPDFVDVPVEQLLGQARTREVQDAMGRGELPGDMPPDPETSTTHLSVWDSDDNVVSVTHTIGTSSGVITPGLGFMYNNSMKLASIDQDSPNAMAPGKARTTGMCPTIVLKDGRFAATSGAPGGFVIINSVLQSLLNVLDFDMTPVEAVSAPRIHCEGGPVFCEARILSRAVEELRRRGHRVEHMVQSYPPIMSRAQLVVRHQEGASGASDPRRDGGMAAIARG